MSARDTNNCLSHHHTGHAVHSYTADCNLSHKSRSDILQIKKTWKGLKFLSVHEALSSLKFFNILFAPGMKANKSSKSKLTESSFSSPRVIITTLVTWNNRMQNWIVFVRPTLVTIFSSSTSTTVTPARHSVTRRVTMTTTRLATVLSKVTMRAT